MLRKKLSRIIINCCLGWLVKRESEILQNEDLADKIICWIEDSYFPFFSVKYDKIPKQYERILNILTHLRDYISQDQDERFYALKIWSL
jgi:hypothetical protein